MKRWLAGLLAVALTTAAHAQAPSPANMGITPTSPQSLDVLDSSKTWVPIGSVANHTFTPVGGGGGGGGSASPFLNVQSVGMQPATDATTGAMFDNAPLIPALMSAISPSVAAGYSGLTVVFPPVPGANITYYYFSKPLVLTRAVILDCTQGSSGTNGNPGVVLVFAAGVDGVIQADGRMFPQGGSSQGSDVRGCAIWSLDQGIGTTTAQTGATTLTTTATYTEVAPLSSPGYGAGDGIIVVPRLNTYNAAPVGDNMLGIQPGAYIDSASGAVSAQTLAFHSGFTAGAAGYSLYNSTGFELFRLPSAASYTVTTEPPSTGAATAAWTTTPNTLTATISGTTMTATAVTGQVCVGAVLTGTGVVAVGDLNSSTTLAPAVTALPGGATHGCSSALGNYTISTAQTLVSSTPLTAGAGIPVAAGTCTGVSQGAVVVDTTNANKKVGTVSLCDSTSNVMALTGTALAASSGAADALSFSSNIVFVAPSCASNGNTPPCSQSTRPWLAADAVWTDGFPFGGLVFRTSNAGDVNWPSSWGQAISVFDKYDGQIMPATALKASSPGKAWEVPAGMKRQITGASHSNMVQYWPTGLQMACSSGQGSGMNCTGSYDAENVYQFEMIGRWAAGDNVGASTAHANSYYRNFYIDLAEMGTVGSLYNGEELESYEGGYARLEATQICGLGQNASVYVGIYAVTAQNQCLPPGGGFTYPSSEGALNGPLWLGAQNYIPIGASSITAGTIYGTWRFYGNTSQTFPGAGSVAGSNVITQQATTKNVFAGLYIWDVTNPASIPQTPPAQIIGANNTQLFLSNAVAASVNGDTLAVGAAPPGRTQNLPCLIQAGGLQTYNYYFGRMCGGTLGGVSGPDNPWYFWYNGYSGAWNYSAASNTNWALSFLNGEYKGYNPIGIGMASNFGLELSVGAGVGGERLLDMSSTPQTDVQTSFTAADNATASNFLIELTGATCTGIAAFNTLTDVVGGGNRILGSVATCSTTQPVATLTAASANASVGGRDNLSFTDGTNTVVTAAQDFFAANNKLIPVKSCAGINPGMTATDASNSGASIGTVSTCGPGTVVTLRLQNVWPVSVNDAIVASPRRQGDIRFNTLVAPGGTAGWAVTSNIIPATGTPMMPFGPVANDNGGNSWTLNGILSAGTKPTNTGSCAINTQLGGATAGSFKANGACAAGTILLTFAAAQVATTGWACDAHDLTTPADLINETAYTTGSVTFAATMAASDLAVFKCIGF